LKITQPFGTKLYRLNDSPSNVLTAILSIGLIVAPCCYLSWIVRIIPCNDQRSGPHRIWDR